MDNNIKQLYEGTYRGAYARYKREKRVRAWKEAGRLMAEVGIAVLLVVGLFYMAGYIAFISTLIK